MQRENKPLQKVSDPYFVRLLIILYYETVLKGTNLVYINNVLRLWLICEKSELNIVIPSDFIE